jgi:acetylornithine deacetylase
LSKDDVLKQVLKEIESAREDIIDFTKKLIQFKSVNRFLAVDKEKSEERICQEFMAEKLAKLGMKVELWEHDPKSLVKYGRRYTLNPRDSYQDRPNLVGVLPGKGGGKSLILSGHIDVVPAEPENLWKYGPWNPVVKDGRMYGRGTADMKGGIGALVYAIECIQRADISLKGDIQIHSVIDEEAGNLGALCVIDRGYTADGCVIPEPTDLGVQPKHKGVLWLRVEVRGRSGHAQMAQPHWRDGGAVSAIKKTMFLLESLERLNNEWSGHGEMLPRSDKIDPDKLLSTPAICPGVIHGGVNPHIIPEECLFRSDIQYLPLEADDEGMGSKVQKEIETYLQYVFQSDPWLKTNKPNLIWESDAESAEIPLSHPFLKTIIHSLKAIGQKSELTGLVSCCDMNKYVNVAHIPTIIYGPGHMDQAHAVDEFIELDKVIATTKGLAAIILHHCGYET